MDSSSCAANKISCKKQGQREHSVKVVYSCEECDVHCHGKPAFNKHMKSHITFKCPACERVFKDRQLLKRHLSDHEKRFQCKECTNRYGRRNSLDRHVATQHQNEGKKWKNELNRAKLEENKGCIDEARNQFMLVLQKQSKNKEVYKQFAAFEQRRGNFRSALKLTQLLVKDLKPKIQCDACSFEASTKSNLEIHSKVWHQKKAKCKKCLQEFENKFSLKYNHDECIGYKCDIIGCMYISKFAAWMKKHKKKHVE